MTFNQVAWKIFRSNLRRYLLYFLCNSFAIMIFFIYASMYTNDKLMNSPKVSSSVTSMLIAPTIAIAVFSVFFILYSHNSFIKSRRTEFGLFMVLGMEENHIRRIIIFENTIIALASIVAGLLTGTIGSRIFFFIVIKLIRVNEIPFELSWKCYFYSALLYIVIYVIMICSSIVTTMSYEVIKLLKETRKEDRNYFENPIAGIFGVLLIIFALVDILLNFKNHGDTVLLRSLIMCFVGTYLLLSNLILIYQFFYQSKPRGYHKNLLFVTNMKYTFGQTKKVLFLITLFVYITVYFCSMSVLFLQQAEKLAIEYNPYHVAYAEVFGMNQISEQELAEIIATGDNKLVDAKEFEFIEQRGTMLIPDQFINNNLGTNLHVNQGQYILLYQYAKDDGYDYNVTDINSYDITMGEANVTYNRQETICKVLFNKINTLSNGPCLILNQKDYLSVRALTNPNSIGKVHLLDFQSWKHSGYVVDMLHAKFEKSDGLEDEVNYLAIPTSRIANYEEQLSSASFMLFLYGFIGSLFFLSSGIILHFKLLTDIEREKVKYRKLYKIGITDSEAKRMIEKELRALFLLPVLLGILYAMLYSYSIPIKLSDALLALKGSAAIGIVYIIIQVLLYNAYKKYYSNKVLLE